MDWNLAKLLAFVKWTKTVCNKLIEDYNINTLTVTSIEGIKKLNKKRINSLWPKIWKVVLKLFAVTFTGRLSIIKCYGNIN